MAAFGRGIQNALSLLPESIGKLWDQVPDIGRVSTYFVSLIYVDV
jgi:hypothetical protein